MKKNQIKYRRNGEQIFFLKKKTEIKKKLKIPTIVTN